MDKELLMEAIKVQCWYCNAGVPIWEYPRDNNIYHTGTGARGIAGDQSPCSAYRIRRHFDMVRGLTQLPKTSKQLELTFG